MFHMDLGLSRVQAALAALALDRPPFLSVQVVGTNGKGSTSTFLAQILTESGLTTGLYTSPHFLGPRERILVDGRQLPEADWLDAAETVLRVSQDVSAERRLTYFELLTVMAAWLFRQAGCRACVFEAGLGGAHDATTALPHHMSVVTPIGLDHVAILGPTVADIARDKAGALRPGVPAVTGPQEPAVMEVLKDAAREVGCPLSKAEDAFPAVTLQDLVPSMPGPHQRDNFRLAACAAFLLAADHGLETGPEVLARAARRAFIPGRLQVIPSGNGNPAFILDGAHNQPGLDCLRAALHKMGLRPAAMVFACLGDKDLAAMLPLARLLTDGPVYVPPVAAHGRSMDPAELAGLLGDGAQAAASVAEALDKAATAAEALGGPVLVCGSLYLLGEVYGLRPEWLERRPEE